MQGISIPSSKQSNASVSKPKKKGKMLIKCSRRYLLSILFTKANPINTVPKFQPFS